MRCELVLGEGCYPWATVRLRRRHAKHASAICIWTSVATAAGERMKMRTLLLVACPAATHARRSPRGQRILSPGFRPSGLPPPSVRCGLLRSFNACPVQCVDDVRPGATERFRIQFYAVCAARPIIEFRREQLMVRSLAAAAAAVASSSCTVVHLNNGQLTTPRRHSSISQTSR